MAAYYSATLAEFVDHGTSHIIGCLTSAHPYNELQKQQTKAWETEVELLKDTAKELLKQNFNRGSWTLLLEYPIPRRQKRLDAVLLAADLVFCLEFKTGDTSHSLQPQRQVEEYALDLRDFHDASRDRVIVPIVVVPKAVSVGVLNDYHTTDPVGRVLLTNAADLGQVLVSAFNAVHCPKNRSVDPLVWDSSAYKPVLTIIEAAEALYARHDIRAIAHSHAGATNLTITSECLIEIIRDAQERGEKVICFVTGVPGAGKTLVGLNVVHNPSLRQEGRPAGVFLSGNGPLVKIVSAAIEKDHKRRSKKNDGGRTVKTFIQNVHVFIEEGCDKPDKPPVEHVVVFDEAQRAWDAAQNLKKNKINQSEPESILSVMDRHQDWAVLVALVGGGQEIHDGEGGLSEWGETLREKFPHWKVVVSPKALDRDASLAGHRLFANGESGSLHVQTEPSLHLEVSLRSFRARKLTEWVDAVLAGDENKARAIVPELKEFPMVLTRSLTEARKWLRQMTRGHRRCGLVASSGAIRLRGDGLEMSSGFRQGNRDIFVKWFLNQRPDVRSSDQLEVAASEFECQGLELDWIGLCWGGDFTFDPTLGGWRSRKFSGSGWREVKNKSDIRYLLNSYRVLLTRARQGLVLWVPQGEASDETRPQDWFDLTVDYLQRCGMQML